MWKPTQTALFGGRLTNDFEGKSSCIFICCFVYSIWYNTFRLMIILTPKDPRKTSPNEDIFFIAIRQCGFYLWVKGCHKSNKATWHLIKPRSCTRTVATYWPTKLSISIIKSCYPPYHGTTLKYLYITRVLCCATWDIFKVPKSYVVAQKNSERVFRRGGKITFFTFCDVRFFLVGGTSDYYANMCQFQAIFIF